MPGPMEEQARAAKAEAQAAIASSQAKHKEQICQVHFCTVNGKEMLRNDSSTHADTLTPEEYKLVADLRAGKIKSIPDSAKGKDEGLLKGGGSIEAVELCAKHCATLDG